MPQLTVSSDRSGGETESDESKSSRSLPPLSVVETREPLVSGRPISPSLPAQTLENEMLEEDKHNFCSVDYDPAPAVGESTDRVELFSNGIVNDEAPHVVRTWRHNPYAVVVMILPGNTSATHNNSNPCSIRS